MGIEKKEIERLNHTIEEMREELEILQEAVGILMGAVMEDSDEGEEIEIGFNSKYLLEMINQLNEEKLVLEFCDTTSPLIVKESSGNDLIYVLMPMRV